MIGDLYELALSVPWCITDEALEAMLRIAARDPLPEDETAKRMHGPKALATRRGQRREDSRQMTMRDGVAVIPIDGPIYRYADFFTAVSGGVTTEALARDFQLALDDPAAAAVLFMIDSPGGEATGINELADAIYAARGRKPIAAYVEGYGASAAYWIASAADLVVVDDTALVGSIGTVMGVPDPTKRISRSIEFVSRQSPKKRADPTTDTGRAYLQQLVDDMTEVFIAKVARNRSLDPAQILAVEGGLLVGQQAIDAGLADTLGAEERIVQALARRALLTVGPSLLRPAYPFVGALLDVRASQEETPMADGKSFWAGFWGGAKEAGIVPEASTASGPAAAAEPQSTATQSTATQSTERAPDPRTLELEREVARLRGEGIRRDAASFADRLITIDHKALPAERAQLVALYCRAAEDDATHPLAEGSRVALLQTAVDARSAHQLTKELVGDAKLLALAGGSGGGEEDIAQARQSATAYAERQNGKRPA